MGRWTIVNVILGLMVALLGFEIARTWAQKLPAVEVPPPSAVPPAEHEPHEKGGKRNSPDKARAQQAPAALVAAIAEKDLFDPSRRAAAPEETKVEVVPVTKPPENVNIVGVRIFGKDREVFVTDGSQPPPVNRRLRIGDQVAGFTVKAIDPTGVVLTSPSGDTVQMALVLDKGKGQQQPKPGAPIRPGTPVRPGQPPGSPAAGPQGVSPAAGVGVRPPTPPPPPPRPAPGAQPQPPPAQPGQQLPSEVRQKLEQLRQNDKRPGRRR